MQNWSNANLCGGANLVLGAFLFFSPFIFGFEAGSMSQNATITGIAVLVIGAPAAFAVRQEWLKLIVGLWTLVSAWVLGFKESIAPLTVHVIVGAFLAILAAIEIWIMSQDPPRLVASR